MFIWFRLVQEVTGDRLRANAEGAERNADRWYILSAQYGLVEPTQVLPPYEPSERQKKRVGLLGSWSVSSVSWCGSCWRRGYGLGRSWCVSVSSLSDPPSDGPSRRSRIRPRPSPSRRR